MSGARAIVRTRPAPGGSGLQVLVYVRERPELFARICGFLQRTGFSIVDARVNTTRHQYALDSFTVLDPENSDREYRDVMSYVEHELTTRLGKPAAAEAPTRGRVSRQLKAFPLTPEVTIRPDERGQFHYLSLIAGDRPGLLSQVARALAERGIDVQTAKINTLGGRAEDVFLLKGDALKDAKQVIRLEAELIHQLDS